MLEPKQNQSKYMNLNEILETFFTAQDKYEDRIGYFPNMVAQNPELPSLSAPSFGPNGEKLYKQYWNARKDYDYNGSPEAADFLNIVKTITVLYADDNKQHNLNDAYLAVVHMTQNNKIKNQHYALRLLKVIEERATSPELKFDIKRLIAMNPVAKPYDVYNYAVALANNQQSKYYRDAPYELVQMFNDQEVKVDSELEKELHKDVPNIERIRNTGVLTLPGLVEEILRIMQRQGASADDMNAIKSLWQKTKQKYSLENILNANQKDYVQQFETKASIELSMAEQELKKMQQESEQNKQYAINARKTLDERNRENRDLQDQIAKLESELGTEKSKNAVLNATIRTFITESEKRATGSVLNKGKDLAAQIAKLKASLEKQ